MFSPKFEEFRSTKMNSPYGKSTYVKDISAYMDMIMSLVKIEMEEQRRTYEWHKLMIHDSAHPNCLSMKSEYGLPPLKMNREEDDSTKVNGKHQTREEKKCNQNKTSYDRVHQDRPKLCPLIQLSLDRQWICDQFPGKRFTLDNIASFSCSMSNKTPAQKIALLKNQKKYKL